MNWVDFPQRLARFAKLLFVFLIKREPSRYANLGLAGNHLLKRGILAPARMRRPRSRRHFYDHRIRARRGGHCRQPKMMINELSRSAVARLAALLHDMEQITLNRNSAALPFSGEIPLR